jgi:hypothetical protein
MARLKQSSPISANSNKGLRQGNVAEIARLAAFFRRVLLAARILRDLRRFAEKQLLGIAFERADSLINFL